jgi:hypothetical protein
MTWYNPFSWFSSTDADNNESEDSTYEDEVIERCDHEFETTTELLDTAALAEARLIEGHLVFPQYRLIEEYCENCGEPGYEGEPVSYPAYDYTGTGRVHRTGKRTEVAQTVAVPLKELDPEVDPADALSADADYAVDEDGEATVIEGEGEGRIIVNESEQETPRPAAAGGPTDD